MKRCSSCKVTKPFEDFSKNKSKFDGFHNQCKSCRKKYADENEIGKKAWRNPIKRIRYQVNHSNWQTRNKDYYNTYMREWNKENKDYSNPKLKFYAANRRSKQRNAIPSWVDSNHKRKIERIYRLASRLSRVTGEIFEVDHIIPLNNKKVCGLHVWWNLQILPQFENRSKGNKIPKNITSPRVSEDSFEEYLQSQFKIYADQYRKSKVLN